MKTNEMTRRQAYEILGVSPDASTDAVKAAYRKLVQRYHPDKFTHLSPGKEDQQRINRTISGINEAYRILEQPHARSADPTDQLWQSIRAVQEQYAQTVLGMAATLPRGIAAVQASSMAMATVLCPWLVFNPFFTATQQLLQCFATADALEAPPTDITPDEAEYSGRCLPAPAQKSKA